MLPPLGHVTGIQAYMPTNDMIEKSSVLAVETTDDLSSQLMGVVDYACACKTCGAFLDECPGHHGHLVLPIPAFRVFFVERLLNILNSVCFFCQRLRLPPESHQYQRIMELEPKHRLDHVRRHGFQYKRCGAPREYTGQLASEIVRDEDGCGRLFIKFMTEDRSKTFVKAVVPLEAADEERYRADKYWEPCRIRPSDLYDFLWSLPERVKTLLGCDQWNEPEAHMWTKLPIPSHNTRPAHVYGKCGGKRKPPNDWTFTLRQIVLARNRLRSAMNGVSSCNFSICVFSYNEIVSQHVSTCFKYGSYTREVRLQFKKNLKEEGPRTVFDGVEGAWRELNKLIAAFHSFRHKKVASKHNTYTGPKKGVEDRFRGQKDGRWRKNIIANRVNYALRGVLEGEIFMRPDQIGIPINEAMKLSVKVMVCNVNRVMAHSWIMRGPLQYPGANYVQLRSGEEIDLLFCDNRREIDVNDVIFVHRHVLENDMVIGNRQPTLHRGSAMSFRVRVIPEHVVRLHPCVFPPLAADCDGDEIQVYVPQTIEARAEMDLCAVDQCVMKDGRVMIKCILNAVLGAYLLTRPETVWFDADDAFSLASVLGSEGCFRLGEPRRPIAGGRGQWTGSQLVSLLFPTDFSMRRNQVVIENGQLISGQLDEETLNGRGGIIENLYRDYEDKQVTITFLFWAYQLFQKYLDMHGMSAGYFDCTVDRHAYPTGPGCDLIAELDATRDKGMILQQYADTLQSGVVNPHHNAADVETNIKCHIEKFNRLVLDKVSRYFAWTDRGRWSNGLLQGVQSGSKGSMNVLNQMCGISGQVYVSHQRLEHQSSHFKPGVDTLSAAGLVSRPLATGLDVAECVAEAPGTCEGVLHKNRRTAVSGHAMRRIVNGMMDVVVDRLGRVVDNTGRVLSERYGGDGFDSACLTNERVLLLCVTQMQLPADYGVCCDEEVYARACGPRTQRLWTTEKSQRWFDSNLEPAMTRDARRRWRMAKRDPATFKYLSDDLVSIVQLQQKLRRILLSNEGFDPTKTVVRSPFVFEHVLNRCRAHFRVANTNKVDCTPLEIVQFVRGLWKKLVRAQLMVGTNCALEAVFVHAFNVRKIMTHWRFGLEHLAWLAGELIALLSRAIVQAGESVGTLGTQCLTEPLTQMLLRSTHVAGRVSMVQDGLTQFTNLVNGDFRHVRTSVVIRRAHASCEAQATLLGLSLVRSYLCDVCPQYPEYKILDGTMCVITVTLDRALAIGRGISPRRVALYLSETTQIDLEYFDASFASDLVWRIAIQVAFRSDLWSLVRASLDRKHRSNDALVAENLVYNLYKTVVIGGLPEIETFIAEEITIPFPEGMVKRWRLTLFGVTDRRKEKAHDKRKKIGPDQKTEETFARILRLPWVDASRSSSTDANAVCKVLGLDAARKVLEQEFLNLMSSTTDRRHIDLICRVMSKDMSIQGMKINQIGRTMPALQRVAYEHGPDQMTEICANRETDDCGTVCGANFANTAIRVGTGYAVSILKPGTAIGERVSHRGRLPRDPIPCDPHPIQPDKSARVRDIVFSPKVDGLRIFLSCFKNATDREQWALVDRNNRVYRLPPRTNKITDSLREGTVLDGEFALIPGSSTYALLVFDCLMICGNKSASLRYDQRIELAREAVHILTQGGIHQDVDLGVQASSCLPISMRPSTSKVLRSCPGFPFVVAVKPIFAVEGLPAFQKTHAARLTFPTDGFVFTRLQDEAKPFLQGPTSVLKWKPRQGTEWDENTIDVMVTSRPPSSNIQLPRGPQGLLHRFRSRDGPILMFGRNNHSKDPFLFSAGYPITGCDVHDGSVYEARWNLRKMQWYLHRQRHKDANTVSTIERCLRNINENITIVDIMTSIEKNQN